MQFMVVAPAIETSSALKTKFSGHRRRNAQLNSLAVSLGYCSTPPAKAMTDSFAKVSADFGSCCMCVRPVIDMELKLN